MKSIRALPLLFLATLQFACSRAPDPPNAAREKPGQHASASGKISEEQAVSLLISKLKALKVRDLDCLAFQNESGMSAGAKAEVWEFAAREKHNERCGGDPAIFPVRDRYKVNSAGKVWVYDAANDRYSTLRAGPKHLPAGRSASAAGRSALNLI